MWDVFTSEQILCPQCNSANDKGSKFCGICGSKLEDSPIQGIAQPTNQQLVQGKKYTPEPKDQWRNILGIIGLIIGIGLAVHIILIWLVFLGGGSSFLLLFSMFYPYIFLGIAIIGIVFSALLKQQNNTLKIIGLILNSISLLYHLSWCFIILWIFI